MGGKSATDHVIATLADAQYGVVARTQLLARGLTGREIERRAESLRLRRLPPGRLRGRPQTLDRGGALDGRGARRRSASGLIHVTVPTNAGRDRRSGLRVHRSGTLTERDVAEVNGIPVTSVARTIIDLSRTLRGRELEALIDRADQRGLVDFDDLRSANSASLQAVLGTYAPAPTRSELEERFLQLCDDHAIPRPDTNVRIEATRTTARRAHSRPIGSET